MSALAGNTDADPFAGSSRSQVSMSSSNSRVALDQFYEKLREKGTTLLAEMLENLNDQENEEVRETILAISKLLCTDVEVSLKDIEENLQKLIQFIIKLDDQEEMILLILINNI